MLFEHIDILDEHLDWQKDCFVGVKDSHIVYVGKEAPADASSYKEHYDGRGKLLMSAFYNTHAHAAMTLLRGYAEEQPLQAWLQETVWPFEGKMDEKAGHLYWGTMLAQAEMLRYGVVSYTDMYNATLDRCKATHDAHMKANHCDGGTMCFVEKDYDTLPVAKTNEELFKTWHKADGGRILGEMCIHGEYTTPEGMIRTVAQKAAEYECGVHLHLSETKSEHEECKERHNGMTPAAWMNNCGVFDNRVTAAHCVWAEDSDIELLAQKKVNVSLNPASNMKLASGFAPVQKMIDAHVPLSIGTDGMASNNTHNILQSAYLLACSQKGNALDPTVVPAKEVLRMLTFGGAQAQGRNDCGVLKEGNRADLIVFDINTPQMLPVFDMAVNVLYSANAADIVLTMCDGEVLYENGDFKTIDIEKTASETKRSVEEILTALKTDGEQALNRY